jgi:carbon monoxide dehydrogenase subunit G
VRFELAVSAPQEAWSALGDPALVAAALPGCRSVVRGADGWRVVTDVAVASVQGLWAGNVTAVDADAVRVVGSGDPASVDLVVRADPERTRLTVEGTVDGPLATIGSALLAAAIGRLATTVLASLTSATAHHGRQNEEGVGR